MASVSKEVAITVSGKDKTKSGTEQAKGNIEGLGESAAQAGAKFLLVTEAIKSMANMLKEFIAPALEFNANMERSAIAMDGAGGSAEELSDSVRDLSDSALDGLFSYGETAKAFRTIAAEGRGVEGSMKILEAAMNVAATTGLDLTSTTNDLENVMSAWNLTADDSARISDVLVNTWQETGAEVNDLIPNLQQMGQLMTSLGISFEEGASLIGVFKDVGIEGVTGLLSAFSQLANSESRASEELAKLGISAFKFTPEAQAAMDGVAGMTEHMRQNQIQIEREGEALADFQRELNATTSEMTGLSDAMAETSLEEQKNRLQIAKIRQQASNEGMELTEAELAQIAELEAANGDLSIRQQELAVSQSELRIEEKQQTRALKEQQEVMDQAEKSGENWAKSIDTATEAALTMGAELKTPLELFPELETAGISATQALELFGIRGSGAMIAAVENIDTVGDVTVSNMNASGEAMESAAGFAESHAGEMEKNEAEMENLQQTLGEGLLPALTGLLELLQPTLEFLQQYPEVVYVLVGAFVAWKIATAAHAVAVGIHSGITGINTAAIWANTAAMLANPIFLIALIIALVVLSLIALYQNWDKVTEAVGKFNDGPGKDIADFFGGIGDSIAEGWDDFVGFFEDAADTAATMGKEMIDGFLAAFGLDMDMLMEAWNAIMSGDFGALMDSEIGQMALDMLDSFLDMFGLDISDLTAAWDALISGDFINDLIDDAMDWGMDFLQAFLDGITAGLDDAGDVFGDIGESAGEFLKFGSPTKKGPFSQIDKWAKPFGPAYADSMVKSFNIEPQMNASMGKAVRDSVTTHTTKGGATIHNEFNIYGGDPRELERTILRTMDVYMEG